MKSKAARRREAIRAGELINSHTERGIGGGTWIGAKLRASSVRFFKKYPYQPLTPVIEQFMEEYGRYFQELLLSSHMLGMETSVRRAAWAIEERRTMGAYRRAVGFLQKRNKLTDGQLEVLAGKYDPIAFEITRGLGDVVEEKANRAITKIVAEGMHVKAGVKELRQAFDAAGVTLRHKGLIENLVRTNTAMAYGAGRWAVNSDPAIQEILWGYEYFTVGDDRVRPNHAALEGTKVPKEDPLLDSIWTPNGYQCRCQLIEVFFEGERIPPPEEGHPDKGWDFNAGKVYGDMRVGTVKIAV